MRVEEGPPLRRPFFYQAPRCLPYTTAIENFNWAPGLVTAFPCEPVEQDLDRLSGVVIDPASLLADQAWQEVRQPGEEQINMRAFLQEEWTREIRPGLMSLVLGNVESGT